jgi:aldose 1-epimerase
VTMIRLTTGAWECAMRPDLGGATVMLRHDGRDVLRPCAEEIDDPLDSANFVLVPYANRIDRGRFTFERAEYLLPANFGDHPHPLHGIGWHARWSVAEQSAGAVRLRHDHPGDPAWPWRYHAEQEVAINGDAVRFAASVRNTSEHAMPAGLGFHPYFPRTAGAAIKARLGEAWIADDTMLPVTRTRADHFGDWAKGAPVERNSLVDHCHGGWDGVADIATNGMTIRMTSDSASWLHLYLPPGADFFCVEPVSHLPNAINQPDPAALGLKVLEPGETMRIAMTLAIL